MTQHVIIWQTLNPPEEGSHPIPGLKNEVNSIYPATHDQGISLRQAALVAGLGLLIMTIAAPFLLPDADPGFLFITFLGESVFMLWLLIRGWKIQ